VPGSSFGSSNSFIAKDHRTQLVAQALGILRVRALAVSAKHLLKAELFLVFGFNSRTQ
jgi:hypothetical protein